MVQQSNGNFLAQLFKSLPSRQSMDKAVSMVSSTCDTLEVSLEIGFEFFVTRFVFIKLSIRNQNLTRVSS